MTLETRDANDAADRAGAPRPKDLEKLERNGRASAHRAGLHQGREAGRSAGDRVPRHRARALRLDALRAGRRVPAGSVRPALRRALGHHAANTPPRRSFPACAFRTARSWAPRGWRRRTSSCKRWNDREMELLARGGRVLPPTEAAAVPARGQGGGGGPAHDPAARELRQRGREAAHQGARSSSCRWPWTARSTRWATATSRRATPSAAARRSRWARRRWCAFKIHKGVAEAKRIVWPRFSHPGFFAGPEACRCRAISSPPWACRSRPRAATRTATSRSRRATP